MLLAQTSKEAASYSNRYATAFYVGGEGYPPRSGLVQHQEYAGQILDGGRFHILKPDRMCCVSEFLDFQLVSKQWRKLSENERSLLIAAYSQKKLTLDSLSTDVPITTWNEAASCLSRAGYLRWTNEQHVVELTLVGEAEIQHQIFNLSAGDNVLDADAGIRIQHHSIQEHEIDLGRRSTLAVNVDGMLIRIFTLPTSGVLVRIDCGSGHRVYMSRTDEDRGFTQAYIDRVAPLPQPEAVHLGEER
ncbi:MAG: hypothetical protein SF123_11755 [Chloroflexota bacterium]|nr:hypothetical protein [Chloroflexota bacterium]